ncbi:hypothetical protein L873DRAFT_710193 [Choiromyces venosus 120613-1]|uniref:Uncharacterized protein n=1 Tax=Choiromyces venosus 120613-1 TaxID=1336337 RepID=A0A3N4JRI4_9PEZI|nr:hypothetical protein L873DRAFT_710193 [Choiromyces venosus 120613-1]
MKKCKGSVYKMAEPPFVEKCVRDPRKMEKKRKRQPLEDGSEHCIPSGRITPCQPEQNLLRPLRKKRSVGESSYPACYTAGEVQDETAAEFQVHFQAECSNSEKSYLDTCYTGGDPKLLNAASGSDFINTASSSDFNTPPSTNNTGLLGYRSSTRQNKSFSQIPSTPAYSVLMPHQIEEILSPTDSINHDYQVRTQRGGISSLETLNSCPTSSPAMIGGSQQINPVFSFPSESP